MDTATNESINTTKDKMTDKANQTFNTVKDTMKDQGNEFKNEFKSGLKAAVCSVEDAAIQAGKNANELAHSVSDRVYSASESVAAEIRKKPVQSAFIALAIGVIGTLFYHRRSV